MPLLEGHLSLKRWPSAHLKDWQAAWGFLASPSWPLVPSTKGRGSFSSLLHPPPLNTIPSRLLWGPSCPRLLSPSQLRGECNALCLCGVFAFLLMIFSFSHIVLEMTSVSCDLMSFFELAFCGEGGRVVGSLLKRPPGRAGKEGLHPCPNTADKTPRTVFSTPAFLFRVDCALLLLLLPKLVFVFMI